MQAVATLGRPEANLPRGFVLLGLFASLLAYSLCAADNPAPGSLLAEFRAGPLAGVRDFVFAVRRVNETDGHWYANIGYYAHDQNRKAWREGAKLYLWNSLNGELHTLLDDPRGGIRDPQLSYDATKVLFSYRKGGAENYLLYEINIDGSNLRQLTRGEYDDIEPSYLPTGDIVFVSTRCKRWVNCWLTQVAIMHRCDGNGDNIRPISSNNEQDNTPWPLPDGRILYTRWEYVDRSQVDYHHLWVSNPDGTGQMVYFGNQQPGTVMIDAKPIPGTDKVLAVFSPGHGWLEHAGPLAIVDPKGGPDAVALARRVSDDRGYRDPWPFSESCSIAALDHSLVLLNDQGRNEVLFRLPEDDIKAGMLLHEPRPVFPRHREDIVLDRSRPNAATGHLIMADIYEGRNMAGVRRGEVKKLLVLESLPMPIHYTGGMDPISYGGTFTLERIVGTVPVEPDGSAYFELPALRSFFFVPLDENDLSVKRMQSFLTVQPGETTSCVGCHEQRTIAPPKDFTALNLSALRRPPSVIEPIAGVPEVIDFPRDVQPILDQLCVRCHGYEKTDAGGPRAGRLILSGDRGPMFSHSYYMLTIAGLFSDGRNQPQSNYQPRAIGSSASKLLRMLDGSHYDVRATAEQLRLVRLWIESGAAYPGTYAALGTGMIGSYAENRQIETDFEWPTTKAGAEVVDRRCVVCHQRPERSLPRSLSDERGVSFWQPVLSDPRLQTSRHIVFNLTSPERSLLLLAPLSKNAGGWGLCRASEGPIQAVFADASDPDYQKLLEMVNAGKQKLDAIKRFDMPDFRPRQEWVREMRRFKILPEDLPPPLGADVYRAEQAYWRSLWHQPTSD